MASEKRTIRIIKREERKKAPAAASAAVPAAVAAPPQMSAGAATRELAATVTGWVNEFRQRRPLPARYAFAGLFK